MKTNNIMNITEVKEHFKDAKIVECLVDNNNWVVSKDHELKLNEECFYFERNSEQIILLYHDSEKGFAKIIEYKTKAKCKKITMADIFSSPTIDFYDRLKFIGMDVPDGMTIDYDSIKFKKIEKQLPNSWEEYVNNNINTFGHYSLDKYNALRKLELLRDCYNDGWVADPDNNDFGYSYLNSTKGIGSNGVPFLHLKTPELRKKFLDNFSSIIEIAKPLL